VSAQTPQRIPQDFIDTLLDRTDIVDVIDSRVKLKSSGRNYTACCPFHKEKTPSFSVAPDKQFYYCFGCGAGGNAIGFLMELEHLSFPEAVEELARKAGMDVPKQDQNLSPAAIAAQQAKTQARNQAYDLLEQANVYYQKQLRQHPQRKQAVSYLQGRGLSGQIAQRFGIGFAPTGWQNLLDNLASTETAKDALIDIGMVVKKPDNERVYDFFRERIMFPIRNSKGKVIAFGGRVLGDGKPKYLNSPESAIFHKEKELYGLYEARQHNRDLKRLLVVEGYMDVVALAQHQIHFAVATLGTATSQFHLERIFKMVSEVIFCFDGDAAGIKAAVRAMHTCVPFMTDGRQARFLLLPQGEDPDTMVRKHGSETLTKLIANATPFSEFLFQHFSQDLDSHNLEHRAKLATDMMPVIQAMPKGLMRSMMLSKLEDHTGLNQDTLAQLTAVSDTPDIDNKESSAQPKPDQSTLANSKDVQEPVAASKSVPDLPPDYVLNDQTWATEYHPEHNQHSPSHSQQPSHDHGFDHRQGSRVQNPAQAAIRLILRHPGLAEAYTEIPEHLRYLRMHDASILVQLLEICQQVQSQLQRVPQAVELQSECADLEAWPMMRNLASLESLTVTTDHSSQLQEAIDKLHHHYFDQRFDDLSQSLRNATSDEHINTAKQQLKILLGEKETLQKQQKSR
jgi:DNA primase